MIFCSKFSSLAAMEPGTAAEDPCRDTLRFAELFRGWLINSSNEQGGVWRIAIRLRTPRRKFANLSIVLVLSEAEPSGRRPRLRIGVCFGDKDEYDHGNTFA